MKLQVVPSQLVVLAPVGLGQDEHEAPQESTPSLGLQIPLQSCVPDAHTPEHAAALSMQTPAQSFIPVGQAGRHEVPSQVTDPPVGFWHVVHEVAPQLSVLVLLTHRPLHR